LKKSSIMLFTALTVFFAVLAYLIATSLVRRTATTFEPTPIATRARGVYRRKGIPLDTLTVDARDTRLWRFVDLDDGLLLSPPDTSGWDVAIRRFHIIGVDAIADLGRGRFDTLARAPDSGYMTNTTASDTTNPAMRHWYRYNMFSHLLEPNGHVYVARTSEGHRAKLEILSYYCPGLEAGCLTFRYRTLQ
jgi:hypothetical protein